MAGVTGAGAIVKRIPREGPCPLPFVPAIHTVVVPAPEGVPVMSPVEPLRLRPVGRVPEVMAKLVGEPLPVTV